MQVVDYGVVRAPKKEALCQRLRMIHEGLASVIAKFNPDVAAVEGAFFGVNARTAIKIGEGRGVALLAVASANVEVVEYPPATVKKSVTGTGRAHKSQVQEMVRLELDLPEVPEPDDAADALALAICHCHRQNLSDTLSR
jgi:crossover junction endodeoxyribonuclease RuvC